VSEAEVSDLRYRQAPVGTPTDTFRPASHTNGVDRLGRTKRPVNYRVQLKVNINEAMAASLQRICRRLGIPEGIGARIAISQFLSQQDPQYRGDNA
jgi:hypothetical protein